MAKYLVFVFCKVLFYVCGSKNSIFYSNSVLHHVQTFEVSYGVVSKKNFLMEMKLNNSEPHTNLLLLPGGKFFYIIFCITVMPTVTFKHPFLSIFLPVFIFYHYVFYFPSILLLSAFFFYIFPLFLFPVLNFSLK